MWRWRVFFALGFFKAALLWGAETDPGRVDPAFIAQGLGSNDSVQQILVQNDNKVLVHVWPSPAGTNEYIKRLEPDGAEDPTFIPPTFFWGGYGTPVSAIVLHNDGILLAGRFTNINGAVVGPVARLKSDGSLDPAFNRDLRGLEGAIKSLAVQSNGKIAVGGVFWTVNERPMVQLARLNADGTLDTNFQSVISTIGASRVEAVLVQADDAIIAAGLFGLSDFRYSGYGDLVRFSKTGSVDPTFVNPLGSFFAGHTVMGMDNEKILLLSDSRAGRQVPFARREPNGSVDTTFNIGAGPNGPLTDFKVQPDGKILVAGEFTSFSGKPTRYVTRLNTDGSLDDTFDSGIGPDGKVVSLALQAPNKILIAGWFQNVQGLPRPRLARLFGGDPPVGAPVIHKQPQGLSADEGNNASLQVVGGGFPLFFRWLRNGETIIGATNSTLNLWNITAAQAGSYQVVLSNSLGEVTSDTVIVEAFPLPTTTNLVLNPGFEEITSNASRPNSGYLTGVVNWSGGFGLDLFRYPADVPLNYKGDQMPLQGSNYLGFRSYFGSNAFFGEFLAGGVTTGQLAQATVPGARYVMEGWFSIAELSEVPEGGVEVLLSDGRGATLSLGKESITDSLGWQRYRRTVVTSKAYDKIVVQGARTSARWGNHFEYGYMDKLSLTPVSNTLPALISIPGQFTAPLHEIVVTNRTTDTDVTDRALIYTLGPISPRGMVIDAFSGVLRWTPDLRAAGATYDVTVRAAYNGSDTLSTTTMVRVVVSDALKLALGGARFPAGASAAIPVVLDLYSPGSRGLTNLTFKLQYPQMRLINLTFTDLHPSLEDCSLTRLDEGNVAVNCKTRPGEALQQNEILGLLHFDSVTNQSTAFVSLGISDITGLKVEGEAVAVSLAQAGLVGIIGAQPLLEGWQSGGRSGFNLYGQVGRRYRLEGTTNLLNPAWQTIREVTLTNFSYEITELETDLPAFYFRAKELE